MELAEKGGMEMSNEKYDYAEEILVGLRKNISDYTGVDDSSKLIDAIIGSDGSGYHGTRGSQSRNSFNIRQPNLRSNRKSSPQACELCNISNAVARLSHNRHGTALVGECCRTKDLNHLTERCESIQCLGCNTAHTGGFVPLGGSDGEWGICHKCMSGKKEVKNGPNVEALNAALKGVRSAKSQLKKSNASAAEKAIPYVSAGLAEPFALAIANGTKFEEVLDLWESKWWKQYEATDILICSVLDGTITEDEGKWLNSVRSDHERLALTCVKHPDMMEWARTLLENGFDSTPDAVNEVLDGGEPVIIARIRNMEVDKELLPPALKKPTILNKPPKHQFISEALVKVKKGLQPGDEGVKRHLEERSNPELQPGEYELLKEIRKP